MSAQENRSLIRQYVDRFVNLGNMAVADELLSPDYRRYLSPATPPLTADGQKQRIAGMRAAFPDLHLSVEDMMTQGDRVAFRGVVRGTHQAAFLGIPPTGKQVTVFAFDVVRIERGKLIEHWGGPDLFSLLSQLGAVVSAGPE
jgi:steroid delta-isomerase-like uncharacterized protein